MADYEDTKVNDLIINNMSQEKFDELKDAGELDPTQLYFTPEEGGAALPDQTGKAGKFLTTDGTTASWSDSLEVSVGSVYPNIYIGSIFTGYCRIAIGKNISGASYGAVSGNIAIGNNSGATSSFTTAIGDNAVAKAGSAIQIGRGTNEDASTFKVGNENGNFEMMDASGNVPLERLTYVTDQIGDISTALSAILGE